MELDFDQGAFIGDARWLEIRVCYPSGSCTLSTLEPRQKLTPAPHALALPGLWTEQTGTVVAPETPNIIGGYSGNTVHPSGIGAPISGGATPGKSIGFTTTTER